MGDGSSPTATGFGHPCPITAYQPNAPQSACKPSYEVRSGILAPSQQWLASGAGGGFPQVQTPRPPRGPQLLAAVRQNPNTPQQLAAPTSSRGMPNFGPNGGLPGGTMRKAPKPAVRPSRPLGRYGGSTSANAGGGTLNGKEKGAAAGSRSNAIERLSGRAAGRKSKMRLPRRRLRRRNLRPCTFPRGPVALQAVAGAGQALRPRCLPRMLYRRQGLDVDG